MRGGRRDEGEREREREREREKMRIMRDIEKLKERNGENLVKDSTGISL